MRGSECGLFVQGRRCFHDLLRKSKRKLCKEL